MSLPPVVWSVQRSSCTGQCTLLRPDLRIKRCLYEMGGLPVFPEINFRSFALILCVQFGAVDRAFELMSSARNIERAVMFLKACEEDGVASPLFSDHYAPVYGKFSTDTQTSHVPAYRHSLVIIRPVYVGVRTIVMVSCFCGLMAYPNFIQLHTDIPGA